jgi:SAM-dependent methyltransferase
MNIHDAYRPFLGYFRGARNARFVSMVNLLPETTVLDVGGTAQYWSSMPVMPRVTLLNLERDQNTDLPQIVGSACQLPCEDKSYDIVFSNSVIEHLGTWENQKQAASEMVRVGKRIWIQTPNKGFFVEPHLITPFIHWLPRSWQRRLLPYTIWGLIAKPDAAYCDGFMREIRLLTLPEMQSLFPGHSIIREKFGFINKSLIAIGTS